MRITPVSQYTYQLTRSGVLFPVNCYLVREADGFTLIDTSISGSARAILAAAKRLGAPIKRMLLTHAHGDHSGSLLALHQALPTVEIRFSTREARIWGGDRTLDANEASQPIRGFYPKSALPPSGSLDAGEQVHSLVAYAAPGHTPGHMAFFDQRDHTLIAGDALSTWMGIAVAGVARPLFPFLKMGTWDLPTATETVKALRALHPTRVVVGHGKALETPDAALSQALRVAETLSHRDAMANVAPVEST